MKTNFLFSFAEHAASSIQGRLSEGADVFLLWHLPSGTRIVA